MDFPPIPMRQLMLDLDLLVRVEEELVQVVLDSMYVPFDERLSKEESDDFAFCFFVGFFFFFLFFL